MIVYTQHVHQDDYVCIAFGILMVTPVVGETRVGHLWLSTQENNDAGDWGQKIWMRYVRAGYVRVYD